MFKCNHEVHEEREGNTRNYDYECLLSFGLRVSFDFFVPFVVAFNL